VRKRGIAVKLKEINEMRRKGLSSIAVIKGEARKRGSNIMKLR